MVSKRLMAVRLLQRTGLGSLLRRLGAWPGVLVLTYHRISETVDTVLDRGVWSATPAALDLQVRFFKQHCDVITPDELPLARFQRRGRSLLLAFDDGYRDNYEQAFPILRSHGLSAVFFVTTGFLDQPRTSWWDEIAWMVHHSRRDGLAGGAWLPAAVTFDGEGGRELAVRALSSVYKSLPADQTAPFLDFLAEATGSGRCPPALMRQDWMTWDMARQMQAAGMFFGGHTVNHPVLARLPAEQQRAEIEDCARRLREELGSPMKWFSYPVGGRDAFDHHTRELLRAEGVQYAFSFYGGVSAFDAWDNFDVRRGAVSAHTTLDEIRAMLALPAVFARF